MEEPDAIEDAMRAQTGQTLKMKERYDDCIGKSYRPVRIDAHCGCLNDQVKKKVRATEEVPLASGGTKVVEVSDALSTLGSFQTLVSSTRIAEEPPAGVQFVVTGDGDRIVLPITEDGIPQRATITQCHQSARSEKYMIHLFTAHSIIESNQPCKRKEVDVMKKTHEGAMQEDRRSLLP